MVIFFQSDTFALAAAYLLGRGVCVYVSESVYSSWCPLDLPLLQENHCLVSQTNGDQGPSVLNILCPRYCLIP